MVREGQAVAVWGAARSGIAAANLLATLGARVALSDSRKQDALDVSRLDSRVELICGKNYIGDAKILVPSPGIRPGAAVFDLARQRQVQIVSEVELAASQARAPIVAITGTDGKSTTTAMTAAAIEQAGTQAVVGGNIGIPFCEVVGQASEKDVLVIEVSAFQLWSCGTFSPDVSIVTNIADDHVEYFDGDKAQYIAAKARLLKDMRPGTAVILRADDPVVSGFDSPDGVHRVGFQPSPSDLGWGFDGQSLTRGGAAIMCSSRLRVPGEHNVANALAALAAGSALGLSLDGLVAGLACFKGLPHRLEVVGQHRGITWYNDSKATNPHAAGVGLGAVEQPQIVITGGYEKGLDLKPFIDGLERAKHVLTVGPTSARLVRELAGRVSVEKFDSLAAASQRASALAEPGDAVILSPAASSFDAYKSYEHRGDIFRALVNQLIESV